MPVCQTACCSGAETNFSNSQAARFSASEWPGPLIHSEAPPITGPPWSAASTLGKAAVPTPNFAASV